jgi:GxxExxY protein
MTNSLNEAVRTIGRNVYQTLGSGFPEKVYECAMQVGFRLENIEYESQKVVELKYRGYYVGEGYPDLVVRSGEEKLVVELKAIPGGLAAPEKQQLKNYMRLLDAKEGLLMNFPQPGKRKKNSTETEPQFENVSI